MTGKMDGSRMYRVLISLASNWHHEEHLSRARRLLEPLLKGAVWSEEIRTIPEGLKSQARGPEHPLFRPSTSPLQGLNRQASETLAEETEKQAPYYLNQLVSAETNLSADELVSQLKNVETTLGRTVEMRSMGIVPIDLDLLLHDNRRYHHRDWQRSYVRLLLPAVENAANAPT